MKHYTKNTVSVYAWCGQCKGQTPHRVDNGRRGPCLTCIDRLDKKQDRAAVRAIKHEQASLFAPEVKAG